jgi:hypothetical protein
MELPNKIYTGNTFRVAENNPIFGGITPRPIQPSTYTIPTTIQSGPILGTYQPIRPTPTPTPIALSALDDDFETKLKKFMLNEQFRKDAKLGPSGKSFTATDEDFIAPGKTGKKKVEEEDEDEEKERSVQPISFKKAIELSKTDYQNMYKKLYDENKLKTFSVSAFKNKSVDDQKRIIENYDVLLPEIYLKYKTKSEAGETKGRVYKIGDKMDEIYNEWLDSINEEDDERNESDEEEEEEEEEEDE